MKVTLGVLATAQFLVVLTTSIVNVALPAIQTGLGMSAAGLAWVINAYGLAFGALLMLGGKTADLLGRRKVLLAGLLAFGLASALAALSWSAEVLIIARAAQGVAAAVIAPAALALVLTHYPRGLGVWGAVSGAGGAAGVLLGGLLTDLTGWRSIFYAIVVASVLTLVAAYVVVPRDVVSPGQVDFAGAAAVTVGLVAVTYSLTAQGVTAWLVLVAGLASLVLFVVIQRRVAAPLMPLRIFRSRSVVTANLTMTVLGGLWVGLFFFLPLYQQKSLGYTPLLAGLTQLPLALAIIVSSAFAPRFPARKALLAGLALVGGGLAWFGRAPAGGTFLADILGPSLLVGVGLGLAFVHLTTLAGRGVQPADAGVASGLINTSRQVGGAAGLAVLIAVAGVTGYGLAFALAAGFAVAAILIVLVTTQGEKS